MICASCDRYIPDSGIICPRCNVPEPRDRDGAPVSHHELASTVRTLKGLLLLSIFFGLFAAPFVIYAASKALIRHGQSVAPDPATGRQLRLQRRLAVGLLVFWAFFLGGWMAQL